MADPYTALTPITDMSYGGGGTPIAGGVNAFDPSLYSPMTPMAGPIDMGPSALTGMQWIPDMGFNGAAINNGSNGYWAPVPGGTPDPALSPDPALQYMLGGGGLPSYSPMSPLGGPLGSVQGTTSVTGGNPTSGTYLPMSPQQSTSGPGGGSYAFNPSPWVTGPGGTSYQQAPNGQLIPTLQTQVQTPPQPGAPGAQVQTGGTSSADILQLLQALGGGGGGGGMPSSNNIFPGMPEFPQLPGFDNLSGPNVNIPGAQNQGPLWNIPTAGNPPVQGGMGQQGQEPSRGAPGMPQQDTQQAQTAPFQHNPRAMQGGALAPPSVQSQGGVIPGIGAIGAGGYAGGPNQQEAQAALNQMAPQQQGGTGPFAQPNPRGGPTQNKPVTWDAAQAPKKAPAASEWDNSQEAAPSSMPADTVSNAAQIAATFLKSELDPNNNEGISQKLNEQSAEAFLGLLQRLDSIGKEGASPELDRATKMLSNAEKEQALAMLAEKQHAALKGQLFSEAERTLANSPRALEYAARSYAHEMTAESPITQRYAQMEQEIAQGKTPSKRGLPPINSPAYQQWLRQYKEYEDDYKRGFSANFNGKIAWHKAGEAQLKQEVIDANTRVNDAQQDMTAAQNKEGTDRKEKTTQAKMLFDEAINRAANLTKQSNEDRTHMLNVAKAALDAGSKIESHEIQRQRANTALQGLALRQAKFGYEREHEQTLDLFRANRDNRAQEQLEITRTLAQSPHREIKDYAVAMSQLLLADDNEKRSQTWKDRYNSLGNLLSGAITGANGGEQHQPQAAATVPQAAPSAQSAQERLQKAYPSMSEAQRANLIKAIYGQ